MGSEVPLILLILALPIYFLSKWLLRKLKLGNDKNRKYLAIFPAVILSPVLYAGIIIIWIFSVSYYPAKDFDKQKWQSNIEQRYEMSADIIVSKILIGKTKNQVIELLGNDYSTDNDRTITYDLGHVPSLFNIDPDFLEIEFENGIVINVNQIDG